MKASAIEVCALALTLRICLLFENVFPDFGCLGQMTQVRLWQFTQNSVEKHAEWLVAGFGPLQCQKNRKKACFDLWLSSNVRPPMQPSFFAATYAASFWTRPKHYYFLWRRRAIHISKRRQMKLNRWLRKSTAREAKQCEVNEHVNLVPFSQFTGSGANAWQSKWVPRCTNSCT